MKYKIRYENDLLDKRKTYEIIVFENGYTYIKKEYCKRLKKTVDKP